MNNLQLVFKQDESNVLMTDSRRLADGFNGRHDNVLRKIDAILLDTNKEFNRLNFELAEYVDAKGEKRPMYKMTRDGFMHIALTFGGKKGCAFRVKVIHAFNQMESELKSNYLPTPQDPLEMAELNLNLAKEERRLRLLTETKLLEAEKTAELYRETVVELDTQNKAKEEKLQQHEQTWDRVKSLGKYVGTKAYFNRKGLKLRIKEITGHTQACKKVAEEAGIKAEVLLNSIGQPYWLFPLSVHDTVYELNNRYMR